YRTLPRVPVKLLQRLQPPLLDQEPHEGSRREPLLEIRVEPVLRDVEQLLSIDARLRLQKACRPIRQGSPFEARGCGQREGEAEHGGSCRPALPQEEHHRAQVRLRLVPLEPMLSVRAGVQMDRGPVTRLSGPLVRRGTEKKHDTVY